MRHRRTGPNMCRRGDGGERRSPAMKMRISWPAVGLSLFGIALMALGGGCHLFGRAVNCGLIGRTGASA